MGLNKESRQVSWAAGKDEKFESLEYSSSIGDHSESSSASSSLSADIADDASSSSSSPRGPLFELAELMAQLPIKRGLSKFYNGKSQTFASLASVRSVEDLAKETCSYNQRMKSCKSYGGNLNHHQQKFGPKATIAKRSSPKGPLSPRSLATKGTTMAVN